MIHTKNQNIMTLILRRHKKEIKVRSDQKVISGNF